MHHNSKVNNTSQYKSKCTPKSINVQLKVKVRVYVKQSRKTKFKPY